MCGQKQNIADLEKFEKVYGSHHGGCDKCYDIGCIECSCPCLFCSVCRLHGNRIDACIGAIKEFPGLGKNEILDKLIEQGFRFNGGNDMDKNLDATGNALYRILKAGKVRNEEKKGGGFVYFPI